jgi:hypothetical protein
VENDLDLNRLAQTRRVENDLDLNRLAQTRRVEKVWSDDTNTSVWQN